MLLSATVLFAALSSAVAECPNACSAHGRCGAYDMCTCYRNWMANDCSERICQFGLAHVDTPKGDLDASSGILTGPGSLVGVNSPMYPAGTSEQFPDMVDSDQTVITNTAHYYMECSNKGICDRGTGTCACFDGYGGSACQRAECPDTGNGVCSGHGTCENIKTISSWDYGNIYKLWDEQATMGCVCDGGYQGVNCEEKICKFGADPLYQDSFQTIRYSNWTYSIYTKASGVTVTGNYSLVFHDATGENWHTKPIDIAASCSDLIDALETIPNNVINTGSVLCHKWAADTTFNNPAYYEPVDTSATNMKVKYTVAFPQNVGVLKDLEIDIHLDGARSTLYTNEATSTLGWYIYSNGFYGENDDFVPDLCTGVLAQVRHTANGADVYDQLTALTTAEIALLKKCLGDGDGDATNNAVNDVENWDHGSEFNPHLIKLVDATQDELDYTDSDPTHSVPTRTPRGFLCTEATRSIHGFCDRLNAPGFYAAIWWDGTTFRIFGRPSHDFAEGTDGTNFHVYTTTGYLKRVLTEGGTNEGPVAFNTWNLPNSENLQYDQLLTNKFYTMDDSSGTSARKSVACELFTPSASDEDCLSKGDYIMLLQTGYSWYDGSNSGILTQKQWENSAIYPQIYQVKKISDEPIPQAEFATSDPRVYLWTKDDHTMVPTYVRHQIVTDKALNIQAHLHNSDLNSDTSVAIFKFYPPTSKYTYAAPCSNRGVCDHNSGVCQCFPGFTSDNCNTIDALA